MDGAHCMTILTNEDIQLEWQTVATAEREILSLASTMPHLQSITEPTHATWKVSGTMKIRTKDAATTPCA